jgi:hypothetical protein
MKAWMSLKCFHVILWLAALCSPTTEVFAGTQVASSTYVGNITGDLALGYRGPRKLVRDADGYWYAVWLGYVGGQYRVYMNKSSDTTGTSWNTPVMLCGSGGIVLNTSSVCYYPAIDIDRANGRIHLVFQVADDYLYYAKLIDLSNWSSSTYWKNLQETSTGSEILSTNTDDFSVAQPALYQPTIALDSGGNPHVAWCEEETGGSGTYRPYYATGSVSGGWNSKIELASATRGQPTVEVDSQDRVHVFCTYSPVIYEYYADSPYTSFSGPNTVIDSVNIMNNLGLSVAADDTGSIHLATHDPMGGDIWTAFFDGSSWTTTQDMDAAGWWNPDVGVKLGTGGIDHVVIAADTTDGSVYSWKWSGSAWGQPETDTGENADIYISLEKKSPAGSRDQGFLYFDDNGTTDAIYFGRVTGLGYSTPLVAYTESSANTDVVRYRTFDGTDWGSESTAYDTNNSGVLKWHTAATSADGKKQAVVAVGTDGNTLYAALYDGSVWTTASLGAVATSDSRCFAAAYESQSGRLLIAAATSSNYQIKYWVHDGSSWTVNGSTYNFSSDYYQPFSILRMDARPGSNQIALIALNASKHVGGLIWDGDSSSWGSEKKFTSTASECPTDAGKIGLDVKYMRAGTYADQAVFAWASNTTTLYSWTWTGSAWESARKEKTSAAAGSILWVELAADPNSSKLLAAIGDANDDLFTLDWSGAGWGTSRTITSDLWYTAWYGRRFAIAFESGASHQGHAVIAYSDSANLKYRHTSDITGAWGSETNVDTGADCNFIELARDTGNTIHLLCQADGGAGADNLKAYSWDKTSWTSRGTLESDLQSDSNGAFQAFAVTGADRALTENVTAVRLLEFMARGEEGRMAVAWRTAEEVKSKGFDLYRAESPGGPWVKLNAGLIPSGADSGEGAGYRFLDAGAVPFKIYYYRLEDVDATGTRTAHGPVCVDWDGDGMADDWEIAHGLDPAVDDAGRDADGDGAANGQEYARRTDPQNRDTDGDGVLDGAERKEPAGGAQPGADFGPGVEVLTSGPGGLVLELLTPRIDATVCRVGGEEYERVRIPDYVHGVTAAPGEPELPVKGILIEVPAGRRAGLRVLETQSRSLPGYRIYPAPSHAAAAEELREVFVFDEAAYAAEGFRPTAAAELSAVFWSGRGAQQRVLFHPLAFNAAQGRLLHRERIRVEVVFEEAPAAAAAHRAAAAAWERPAGAAVKLETVAQGLHRVTRDDLLGQGIAVETVDALDLSRVQLFNRGVEQAIRIVDAGGDGRLDPGDAIVFYAEPVPGAYSKYSRANVYWLIDAGSAAPRRMGTVEGAPAGGPLAASHWARVRHEQNESYLQAAPGGDEMERWVFASVALGSGIAHPQAGLPKSFTLDLPGALGPGELAIRMYGPYDMDHAAAVELNGSALGSAAWSGIGYHEAAFAGLGFAAGANTVAVTCESGEDRTAFDWFEAYYERDFTAAGDRLEFRHAGGYRYRLGGFSEAGIELYDVSDPEAPVRVVNGAVSGSGPYQLEAEPAGAAGERRYAAATASGMHAPAAATLDGPSRLQSGANGADWILITHRELGWENGAERPWVAELAALRQSQGLRTMVVDVADIYDEFGFGFPTPHAIRDFLAYAAENWQPPAPAYLLLVGDTTYDYRDNRGLGTVNHVPSYLVYTTHLGETASDEWYTRLSGRWGLSAMAVGRLPAADAAQAERMAAKIVAYERARNAKDWERRSLFAADNHVENWEAVFEAMAEEAIERLAAGMAAPGRFYLQEYQNENLAAADLSADLTQAVNAGALILYYGGHAGVNTWSTEKILEQSASRQDIARWENAGRLPLVVGMTCLSGYFVYPYLGAFASANYLSLAESLMRPEGGGAVAALLPTGMTEANGQRVLSNALMEAIFSEDRRRLGDAVRAAKLALLANASDGYAETADTFLFFGDPATELKVPLPRRPQGLAAQGRGAQAVKLSWRAAADCNGNPVSGYHVYRKAGGESGYSRLTSSPVAALGFTDLSAAAPSTAAALSDAITITYAVSAVDADGDESALSAPASVTIAGEDAGGADSGGGGGGCFIAASLSDAPGRSPTLGAAALLLCLPLLWRRGVRRFLNRRAPLPVGLNLVFPPPAMPRGRRLPLSEVIQPAEGRAAQAPATRIGL